MKKFYTIIYLCLFAFGLQAQFLMRSNTHLLRTGDEHCFIITNNVGPGVGGQLITWDFRALSKKSELTSYMYSAYNTEKSMEIPEANAVLEEYGNMFYFKVSDGIIEQYGTVTPNNTITRYDKPFIKMVFPFKYGDSYSGDFSGTIEGQNNYSASFTGTYSHEVDAYGTLILPGNIIYENVIRIKTVKEQCYNNQACNCQVISFKWYSEDVRYPLLTIIQNNTSEGLKTTQTAYFAKAENTNTKQEIKTFSSQNIKAVVYPNPFKGEFKIDYTTSKDSDVVIEIYDNSGKKVCYVSRNNQKAGAYTETINSYNLGSQLGMYHIRIMAGNEIVTKTIVRAE